jgi:hypothetical protein
MKKRSGLKEYMTRKEELLRSNNKDTQIKLALKLNKPALNSPLEKTRREPKEEKDKNKVFV